MGCGVSRTAVSVGTVSVCISDRRIDCVYPGKSGSTLVSPFLRITDALRPLQMSVVSSAVDTVIVCFAEAPNELRLHYPFLSDQMVRAWRRTYPEEFVYAFLVEDDDAGGIYTAPPTSQVQQAPLVPPPDATAADKSDALAPQNSQN